MTHTPGPWAYDGTRVYAPALEERYLVRRDDGSVGTCTPLIALVYARNDGAAAANAALIALAPELLACCRQVLAVIDRHADAECGIATVERLRAAVAQIDGATVETP